MQTISNFLTIPQAADHIGVHRSHLHKVIEAGMGPPVVYIGGARRIESTDLVAWIEGCKRSPQPTSAQPRATVQIVAPATNRGPRRRGRPRKADQTVKYEQTAPSVRGGL